MHGLQCHISPFVSGSLSKDMGRKQTGSVKIVHLIFCSNKSGANRGQGNADVLKAITSLRAEINTSWDTNNEKMEQIRQHHCYEQRNSSS